MKKPVVLAILDGLGLTSQVEGNAVAKANKENLERCWNEYSNTTLEASGLAVGLPKGQMGNSEVGHLNIGAGRKVYQSLVLINKMIEDGDFFKNKEYLDAINHVKENNSTLHVMGLLSDGGVHSHIDHIKAMLKMAKNEGVSNVCVHAFLDGRDVAPASAKSFLNDIQKTIDELGVGKISTISGRYYAMDRDKRWDRVELAYDTIINAKSDFSFDNWETYIDNCYAKEEYDEFVMPAIAIGYEGAHDNDSFIFMNFRPDRAIQLSGIITNPNYDPLPEEPVYKPDFRPTNIKFIQTMKYSDDVIGEVAFEMPDIINPLGDVVANAGLKQLRIAETEKYPHVTYFFDGGIEKDLNGANRILIKSPKVATYDLQPEMSANEVTDSLLKELGKGELDLVILNFANPDMVGHSGHLDATIKAVETVDRCMGKIIEEVKNIGGELLITADHGNSELIINSDGSPNTAHTTNEVPFILVSEINKLKDKKGILADIAPTLLSLLNIPKPKEMTGESLIDE